MKDKTIAIYVFLDDIMIESGHKEPINRNASDSGIITTALTAVKDFHCHIDNANCFVKESGLNTLLTASLWQFATTYE